MLRRVLTTIRQMTTGTSSLGKVRPTPVRVERPPRLNFPPPNGRYQPEATLSRIPRMEPKHDPRAHDLPLEAPAVPGELVVQNGRLSGTRCPLRAPLTLIGRGEDCDIRVNVDGVAPLHCAISLGPQGASLRNFNREFPTL